MNPNEAYQVLLQIVNRAPVGITEQHSVRSAFAVLEELIKKDAEASKPKEESK